MPIALAVLLVACGGDADGSDPTSAELEAAAAETAAEHAQADEVGDEDTSADDTGDETADEEAGDEGDEPDATEEEPEPLPPSPTGEVTITLGEWFITPEPAGSLLGELTFSVTNEGASTHEIVVVPSDGPPEDLPLDAKGDVDEEAEGIVLLDHLERVAGGSSVDWSVALEPGTYILICNLPAHYRRGMRTAFEVVPPA